MKLSAISSSSVLTVKTGLRYYMKEDYCMKLQINVDLYRDFLSELKANLPKTYGFRPLAQNQHPYVCQSLQPILAWQAFFRRPSPWGRLYISVLIKQEEFVDVVDPCLAKNRPVVKLESLLANSSWQYPRSMSMIRRYFPTNIAFGGKPISYSYTVQDSILMFLAFFCRLITTEEVRGWRDVPFFVHWNKFSE